MFLEDGMMRGTEVMFSNAFAVCLLVRLFDSSSVTQKETIWIKPGGRVAPDHREEPKKV